MSSSELPEYAVRNRASWTKSNEQYTHEHGVRAWRQDEVTWGLWGIAESELEVLPDVSGKDVIELGCGTAYFSAWLARRGARPVGVDITPAQLETARQLQRETGLEFPLLEANAENVPLADASFDLALSEYGASIWCDPYKWIPEAARLLRPGG
jgi:ubiquinone/menaquinone biosynthesis C-methylase UbiE